MCLNTYTRMPFNLINAHSVFSSQCFSHVTVCTTRCHSHMCIFAETHVLKIGADYAHKPPDSPENGGKTPRFDYTYCHTRYSIDFLDQL